MGDTNLNVLVWARGEVGKVIGDGSCYALVNKALTTNGARTSTSHGKNDDYVWGDPVELKDIRPGDILQFRDFKVVTTTETEIDHADGSGGGGTYVDPKTRGHHTAIVDAILGPNRIKIIEQHVKPGPAVRVNVIPLRSGTQPPVVTYEDYKDRAGRIHHGAKYTRKATIEVTGKVWAYRPKPKN